MCRKLVCITKAVEQVNRAVLNNQGFSGKKSCSFTGDHWEMSMFLAYVANFMTCRVGNSLRISQQDSCKPIGSIMVSSNVRINAILEFFELELRQLRMSRPLAFHI
jgi:hypothetical protein